MKRIIFYIVLIVKFLFIKGWFPILKTKLIRSAFLIVTCIILAVTAVIALYEKNRCRRFALDKIYYESLAIKSRLVFLMTESGLSYLDVFLSNAKSATPGIFYIIITDLDGNILASDQPGMVGEQGFKTATVRNLSRPLFKTAHLEFTGTLTSRFEIFESRLNNEVHLEGSQRGKNGDPVYDAFWDIAVMDEKIGRLRIGFSALGQRQYLAALIGGILGAGFFVLIITLTLIYLGISKCLDPLDEMLDQISGLSKENSSSLRQKLSNVQLSDKSSDVAEIRQLKKAFSKLKDRFVLNWDQLENHRNNLEKMVDQRTAELIDLNRKLARQVKERKEIETRLVNVQKLEAVGTLAGGVAHEFNNLFMAITGYASLIQKQPDNGISAMQKAEKIKDLVSKGSESVKQLLGFARSGKYTPGLLNMNEVLRSSLQMFGRTRNDIRIDLDIEERIWSVFADRSQMEQTVMSLLINASEAMPEGGRILMKTQNIMLHKKQVRIDKIVSGRFVCFLIRDNGKGIEEKLIPRIFDPFFTTKPMSAGAGLGLSSVYGIVNNHGGFVTVESHVGNGTVFHVFLPAVKKKDFQQDE